MFNLSQLKKDLEESNGANCNSTGPPNVNTVIKEEKKEIVNTAGTVVENTQQTPPSSTPPAETVQIKKEENDTHEVSFHIPILVYRNLQLITDYSPLSV